MTLLIVYSDTNTMLIVGKGTEIQRYDYRGRVTSLNVHCFKEFISPSSSVLTSPWCCYASAATGIYRACWKPTGLYWCLDTPAVSWLLCWLESLSQSGLHRAPSTGSHTHSTYTADKQKELKILTRSKILTASPLENWRRPPVFPRTTWMKTIHQPTEIQQPLPEWSSWRGSELSTLETDVYVWRYALLVVYARNDADECMPHGVCFALLPVFISACMLRLSFL